MSENTNPHPDAHWNPLLRPSSLDSQQVDGRSSDVLGATENNVADDITSPLQGLNLSHSEPSTESQSHNTGIAADTNLDRRPTEFEHEPTEVAVESASDVLPDHHHHGQPAEEELSKDSVKDSAILNQQVTSNSISVAVEKEKDEEEESKHVNDSVLFEEPSAPLEPLESLKPVDDSFFDNLASSEPTKEAAEESIEETIEESIETSHPEPSIEPSIAPSDELSEEPVLDSENPVSESPVSGRSDPSKRISLFSGDAIEDSFFDQLGDDNQHFPGEELSLKEEPLEIAKDTADLGVVRETDNDNEQAGDLFGEDLSNAEDADIFDQLAEQSEQEAPNDFDSSTATVKHTPQSAPPSVPQTATDSENKEPSASADRPSLETAFSFLEEDDELLPDDYLEEEPHVKSPPPVPATTVVSAANPSQYKPPSQPATTTSYQPSYSSPFAPVISPPANVPSQTAPKSYLDQHPSTNAFDLPSNIIPKSTVRSYSSMQNLQNRQSPYAPVGGSAASIYAPPPPASVSPAISNAVSNAPPPPVANKTVKPKKSFFEDLPPIPTRRVVSRQTSMQNMGPSSQYGAGLNQYGTHPGVPPPNQAMPPPPTGQQMSPYMNQQMPPPMAPPIAQPMAPPKNPYSPVPVVNNTPPSNMMPYGHAANTMTSPNSAYGSSSAVGSPDVNLNHANPGTQYYGHSRNSSAAGSHGSLSPRAINTKSPYAPRTASMSPQMYGNPQLSQGQQQQQQQQLPPAVNPYAPQARSSFGTSQAVRPADIYKSLASPVLPSGSLPPPNYQAKKQTGGATLGDLPMDLSRTVETVNRLPGHLHRQHYAAQSHVSNGVNAGMNNGINNGMAMSMGDSQPLGAQMQEPATNFHIQVDNEALLRRQFPVFSWGHSGKVAYVIPPTMNYGSSAPLGCDIRVEASQHLYKNDGSISHLAKFPGPLFTSKGIVKGKKKELEKWIEEKISLLESNPSTNVDRLLLWKFMSLLLQVDGPVTSLSDDKLKEVAALINPRVSIELEARHEGKARSATGSATPFATGVPGHQRRQSSIDQSFYGNPGAVVPPSVPGAVNASGVSKAYREDLQTIYSDLSIGERVSALNYCLDRKHWAHALVIASSLGGEHWHNTIAEFVRESVENVGTNHARSLSLMYRYFGGCGAKSVAALYPARTLSANLAQNEDREKLLVENLRDWNRYLSFMLLNKSPNIQEAILGLGRLLLEQGFVDASHICCILSGASLFGAPKEEEGITLIGSDSKHSSAGVGRDVDSIIMSEIYEYFLFTGNSVPGPPFSPHLLLYKAQHGIILADYGYFTEAQKYVDSTLTIAKSSKLPQPADVLERLDAASRWLSSINDCSSAGWFGSKLGRSKLDQTLMKSFNKFVAGEEEKPVETEITPDDAIFRKLASTPITSATGSAVNSTETTPFSQSGNPYAPVDYQHLQTTNNSLNRTQSANYIHTETNGVPPLNRSQTMAAFTSVNQSVANPGANDMLSMMSNASNGGGPYDAANMGRKFSIDGSSSVRSMSPAYSDSHGGLGAPYGGYGAPIPAAGVLSRPSSSQQARMSPYAIENAAQKQNSSSPSHVSQGPSPAAAQASLGGVYSNPYNPVAHNSHPRKSSTPNPYAPVSVGSSSAKTTASNNAYAPQTSQGQHNGASTDSETAENLDSAVFGYNPYAVPSSRSQSTAPENNYDSYEAQPDYSRDNESSETNLNAEQDSVQGSGNNFGNTFDSNQSGNYQYGNNTYGNNTYDNNNNGRDFEEDDIDDDASGTGYYTPVGAPMPSTSGYAPPDTLEEVDEMEDLGIANSKKPANDDDDDGSDKEQSKKNDKKDDKHDHDSGDKDGKKGWFGWLRKNNPDEPKAVRAKLGEESQFYYDEKLKRWVNKKVPLDEQKPLAPPPPPKKSSTAKPPAGATPPAPSGGNDLSGPPSSASSLPPPPGSQKPPSLKPKPSIGGDLDDLLSTAPPSGGSTRRGARKNARSRYVDIMATKQ